MSWVGLMRVYPLKITTKVPIWNCAATELPRSTMLLGKGSFWAHQRIFCLQLTFIQYEEAKTELQHSLFIVRLRPIQ